MSETSHTGLLLWIPWAGQRAMERISTWTTSTSSTLDHAPSTRWGPISISGYDAKGDERFLLAISRILEIQSAREANLFCWDRGLGG
jgi:hypothetical protein